jgi:hypothetical protein
MELPIYPQLWQCIGMIVAVYGFGYIVAASDPFRHWPIIAVGLLGKVLGPLGFLDSAISGSLPISFGLICVFNDLIWWLPFAIILYSSFSFHCDTSRFNNPISFRGIIRSVRSHRGDTLQHLSADKPLMLIFLRHIGCTFCREALADLSATRKEIEEAGMDLALVHMSPPLETGQKLESIDLVDIHRFSDPKCQIYQAFEIERGAAVQLFGPKVMWRGLIAGILGGHGIGKLMGDGFRMPGVFILEKGEIKFAFRAETAADRPDYVQIAVDYSSGHRNEHSESMAAV